MTTRSIIATASLATLLLAAVLALLTAGGCSSAARSAETASEPNEAPATGRQIEASRQAEADVQAESIITDDGHPPGDRDLGDGADHEVIGK